MNAKIADPKFYQQEQDVITVVLSELAQIEKDLAQAYQRWDELEAIQD